MDVIVVMSLFIFICNIKRECDELTNLEHFTDKKLFSLGKVFLFFLVQHFYGIVKDL